MFWWRRCALVSIVLLIAAPSFAQPNPEHAAREIGAEWLGPHPGNEPDRHLTRPIWQGTGALFLEQQLAQRVVRSWWPQPLADAKADAILDGFAWYLQTRSIERVFDALYLRTAHSVDARGYFGGHVIWSFPNLRLSRHVIASRDPYGAAFETLDRWLGTPALQNAMYEVAHLTTDQLTGDTIINTISNAAGQDVSWAFAAATTGVNYEVRSIGDRSVTVSRRSPVYFPRDAVALKVAFADGSSTTTTWDGRENGHTFQFSGPSTVVAACLDPHRVIAFDLNYLDNSIVSPKPTNVPVRKWAARWMVWLQHTMLSYGFLT